MPDAHARPLYPLAPARLFGLWMSLSACLSLPRARGGRRRLSKVFRAFQPSWLADDFWRGVRHQTSSLARLDGKRWTQSCIARARVPVFPLLSGFRETVDTNEVRAREGGRSQTGETPPVVSVASFRSVSAPEGLPLRETVRPHSEIIGNGLAPQPSDYAPGAPPAGRGVSIDGRALPRRARTNPGHAKLNFGLRTADMKDANPVAAQEMLSAKPPQCRIPKGTLGIGSPPSPHATRARRPGSLKITSSCASTGCGAVTLTASRRPRRHATARCVAVIAPACRHPSRQPSAAAVGEIWRGKPRQGKSANRG